MCKDTEPRALPEDSDSPKWFDGKKVIEIAFCEEFLTRHPMCCIHGRFYTADGPIPDDVVRRLIYEELKAHAVSGVGKAVATLLDVLRMECYSPGLRRGACTLPRSLGLSPRVTSLHHSR